MNKFMKRFLVLTILFLSLASVKGLCDGIIIYPRYPYSLIDENYQLAAINYQDGIQKMIIGINIDMKNLSEALWIFPIPAEPNKVAIDIVSQFPRFSGSEIEYKLKYNLNMIKKFSQFTQIYPFIFLIFFSPFTYHFNALESTSKTLGISEVTIHEHIEKEGIITELISAKSGDVLYNYLRSKGLEARETSIPILDYYIGKNYTFVVSWISSLNYSYDIYEGRYPYYRGYSYRQPGVFISFPTDKIYYPLLPTSTYGSKRIPIRLYVIGYVTPELYNEIKPYTIVGYFLSSYYYPETIELEMFYANKEMKYTLIEIVAPAKYLTNDLWISKKAPGKIIYADLLCSLFSSHPLISLFILTVIFSMVSGAIAGYILFKEVKKFALLGLANLFTIFGVIFAILLFVKIEKLDKDVEEKIKKANLIVLNKRKILFVIIFPILFIIVSLIIENLILLPLLI